VLTGALLVGAAAGAYATIQVAPPAYVLLVSGVPSDPASLGPYAEAAGPLALEAGLEGMVSTADVQVLEGEWPSEEGR
jgi:hypothetical protein